MIAIPVYNKEGKEVERMELPEAVFGVKVNPTLVHDVTVAAFANARQVLAHTKTRGEVQGSGKKPWRQKGTGRARHSSIRSPLWRKGGIVFGPRKDRNFSLRINKKAKAAAMRMILSDRIAHNALIVVDDWRFTEQKTKSFAALKRVLPCGMRRALVVSASPDALLQRVTRNVPTVDTTFVGEMGVLHLVQHPWMLMSKDAVTALAQKYRKE